MDNILLSFLSSALLPLVIKNKLITNKLLYRSVGNVFFRIKNLIQSTFNSLKLKL
jgi:hypothetical protein